LALLTWAPKKPLQLCESIRDSNIHLHNKNWLIIPGKKRRRKRRQGERRRPYDEEEEEESCRRCLGFVGRYSELGSKPPIASLYFFLCFGF
jgi:hypothetical protein